MVATDESELTYSKGVSLWLETIFNAVLKLNDGSVNIFVSVVAVEDIIVFALLTITVNTLFVAIL